MESGRLQFALPAMTPAVKILMIINVAVFLVTWVVGENALGQPLSHHLALSWNGLWGLQDYRGEDLWGDYGFGLIRLITYQFAHDFTGVFHILMNMLVLYFFGTMVETEVGKRGMFHLYLVGGVVGGVAQVLVSLLTGDTGVPIIGASGACYAIMLYAACMAPRMRVIFIVFPIEMRWLVGILVFIGVYQLVNELRGPYSGGTAHGGHLGGALYGYLAFRYFRSYYMRLNYGGGAMFAGVRGWWAERERLAAVERDARVDQLLAKITQHGVGSLTAAEKRFMTKASRKKKNR